jgi:glycosyltransferase involved in cell wall biosynthesis
MSPRGPVRILSLTYAEEHWTNAQQVNAREIAKRLDPSRFEMTLLSGADGPAPVLESPAVRVFRLPRRLRSAAILRRLLSDRQDIVFYPGSGIPETIYLALPRRAPGRRARVLVPVEGDVGQLDEVPYYVRRRVERVLRRADAVVPITSFVAETLLARLGRTGPIVPVGVDLATFRPRDQARRPGPMRVLSVGTVKAWKRAELVRIAAVALPEVQFTWIGGGEDLEAQRAAAPANLHFIGPCDRVTLPEHYRSADVLLHPGRREGLPKVVLESLASAVPVIAFSAWRPEFLREKGAGLVVSDEAGMLAALTLLRDDPARRAAMGVAGRDVARAFDWGLVAAQWATIFDEQADAAAAAR